MPLTDLRKRFVYFVIVAGITSLVLFLFPYFEETLFSSLGDRFGFQVGVDGIKFPESGSKMLETTMTLLYVVLQLAKVVLWMALVITTVKFVGSMILSAVSRGDDSADTSSLITTVLSVVVYIIAFFLIFQAQFPNVQLAPVLTGSTIIGIVVGLALQDTLGNLFAGLAMQADQPFSVGDVVALGTRGKGVVEAVSWRGVKIRTFQNKLLVISNSILGRELIEVAPKNNLNARSVFFNTLYTNSPAKTIAVVREAVRNVENVSRKMRPNVRIKNLGDNGIDWEVKYWLDDYRQFNDTDALIRQRIWYVFQREGLDFAYPTRTIYMQDAESAMDAAEAYSTFAERLQDVSLFSPLSNDEVESLANASRSRVFAPGEPIVKQGKEGESMYVVVSGFVKVQVKNNGIDKTLTELGENDFFGEMSLLTGEPRTATVIASTEAEVLEIGKNALKPILEANIELVESISERVAERKRALDEHSQADGKALAINKTGVMTSIRKFFGLSK